MNISHFSEEENNLLNTYMTHISLSRGETLFQPGEDADGVFFLERGRLGVQTKTGFEDRQQIVALLDPGAAVGERGLAFSGKRGMTVFAIEDSVVFYLSAGDFKTIEKAHPAMAVKMLKKLLGTTSLRLQANSERLAHVL